MDPDADAAEQTRLEEKGTRPVLATTTVCVCARSWETPRRRVAAHARFPAPPRTYQSRRHKYHSALTRSQTRHPHPSVPPPPPRPQQLANGSSSTASATAPRASSDTWNPRRRRCRRRYVKRGPSSFPPRSIDATAVSSLRRHYTSRRSRMNTSSLSRVLPFTTGISPHHTRILPFREPNSL